MRKNILYTILVYIICFKGDIYKFMEILVDSTNVITRKIGEKYVLVDIKNNKLFIINKIINDIVEEILSTNRINLELYSKNNNLTINEAIDDINNLLDFMSSNNLLKGSENLF